ncbi:hypothetical protein WR25_15180 [Diploscapter pachys]|uniref:L antigen family member 3 n=1 Tax=Diploscapter pachys TaxID=2018661 RepID=A0A2A2KP87_9BILA|nr:hypothetical protein WR25_15180 [Diploscapter pachys]
MAEVDARSVESSSVESSDEEPEQIGDNQDLPHTATLRLNLSSERAARIAMTTLAVDKEPSRSSAKRTFKIEDNYLIVDFASHDRKYLQKSIANLMEMCELVMSTLDLVDNKKWLNQPKSKEKGKDKKKR